MSRTSPEPSQLDVGVIIPSGGQGERAGAGPPKQFRSIAGVPMLLRTIRAFLPFDEIREIVVALPQEHVNRPPPWLSDILRDRVQIVAGGRTRADSVRNGFVALSETLSTILIHDAARPFVSAETIERIITAVGDGASAIAAAPVRDTLKRATDNHVVSDTVDRSNMWQAHTPQGFPRDVLTRSYDEAMRSNETSRFTDEASLVERAGYSVQLVEDAHRNFKVTTREDFDLADVLART